MRAFVIMVSLTFSALLLQIYSSNHQLVVKPARQPLGGENHLKSKPVVTSSIRNPVIADPTPASRQTLRVSFNSNPPRKYVNGDKAEGIAAEILKSFAERFNTDLRFNFCDLNTCLERLKKGESDAILEIGKNDERDGFLQFLNPAIMLSANKCFYQRQGDQENITSYKDLKSLRIGTLRGYEYFPEFDKDSAVKKHEFGTIDGMLRALIEGKIDAFIGMEDRTDYILTKNLAQSSVKKSKFQIRENILINFMALAKNSPFMSEIDRIEDTLAAMYLDGTVARVVKQSSMKFRLASAE